MDLAFEGGMRNKKRNALVVQSEGPTGYNCLYVTLKLGFGYYLQASHWRKLSKVKCFAQIWTRSLNRSILKCFLVL